MGGTVRVVIVEDNQAFRETLAMLLPLREGIEVVAAVAHGAEGVDACARLDPDVALVDYRMPGLNGAETARALGRAAPRTRVVCLTASVTGDEVDAVRDAGAVDCLTKDRSLDEIVAALRAAAKREAP